MNTDWILSECKPRPVPPPEPSPYVWGGFRPLNYAEDQMTEPHWLQFIDEPYRSELRSKLEPGQMYGWDFAGVEVMVQLIVEIRRLCEATKAINLLLLLRDKESDK